MAAEGLYSCHGHVKFLCSHLYYHLPQRHGFRKHTGGDSGCRDMETYTKTICYHDQFIYV